MPEIISSVVDSRLDKVQNTAAVKVDLSTYDMVVEIPTC